MSNSKSNSNNVKTKITVMFAAIASVLIAGMGMNSAAYASIIGEEFPGINIDDIGQSAECVGVLVECRENSDNIKIKNNNNNNNGNGGNGDNGNGGPLSCEECLDVLTEVQLADLLTVLNLESEAELCEGIADGSITAEMLFSALVDRVGIGDDEAMLILECLGLELVVIG